MQGRPSRSNLVTYVGALVAIIGVVGYVVFGWRFGESDGGVSLAIGIAVAILAGGLTLHRWLSDSG